MVAVEFPGYGLYHDFNPKNIDEHIFKIDSISVLEYLEEILKVRREDIIIAGRSMGGGPAINLAAAARGAKALLLFCTFSSLKHIFKGQNFGSIEDLFNNEKRIGQVDTPTIICHGKKDSLINYSQAEALYSKSKAQHKMLHLEPEMDHGMDCWEQGVIIPCRFFLDWVDAAASGFKGSKSTIAKPVIGEMGENSMRPSKRRYNFKIESKSLRCTIDE